VAGSGVHPGTGHGLRANGQGRGDRHQLYHQLQEAGLSGALDDSHLRVIETDATGLVLNEQVQFQFDKDADYQASTNASGQLVVLAPGQTDALGTPELLGVL